MSDEQRASREPENATDTEISDHQQLAGLIHAFISMMHEGNIARMDIDYRDLHLSLRAQSDVSSPATVVQRAATRAPVAVDTPAQMSQTAGDQHIVTAPMIGIFYASPAQIEPPFIKPGDHIEEGQTIGIIEAMKIMNEIAADRSGTVVEIVARNAQPVEYGSPLVIIVPDVP